MLWPRLVLLVHHFASHFYVTVRKTTVVTAFHNQTT
jgi:hypothetical protein